MNFSKKTLFSVMFLPALAAGVFGCGAGSALPRGTTVCGTDVSGLSRREAVRAVRADIAEDLKRHCLTVYAGEESYSFRYPQLTFTDDAFDVVKNIARAGEHGVEITYRVNGLDEIVSGICAARYRQRCEPSAHFCGGNGEPFVYDEGQDGALPDADGLRADILASLAGRGYGGDFAPVYLSVTAEPRKTELSQVKALTERITAFTTYFDCGNEPRAANIALAGAKISGCTLGPGQQFSFNGRVGARTAENGFKQAKIIEDGRFVYGTGGGVCQVSTTLYNAALLAGLKVTEYHPHSLAVGYVSPSRDAMVSGDYSDLKFVNVYDCPVYIRVLTGTYYVRCEIYGKKPAFEYSLETEYFTAADGGVESCCYIVKTGGGQSTRRLLRKDRYRPARSGRAEGGEDGKDAGGAP